MMHSNIKYVEKDYLKDLDYFKLDELVLDLFYVKAEKIKSKNWLSEINNLEKTYILRELSLLLSRKRINTEVLCAPSLDVLEGCIGFNIIREILLEISNRNDFFETIHRHPVYLKYCRDHWGEKLLTSMLKAYSKNNGYQPVIKMDLALDFVDFAMEKDAKGFMLGRLSFFKNCEDEEKVKNYMVSKLNKEKFEEFVKQIPSKSRIETLIKSYIDVYNKNASVSFLFEKGSNLNINNITDIDLKKKILEFDHIKKDVYKYLLSADNMRIGSKSIKPEAVIKIEKWIELDKDLSIFLGVLEEIKITIDSKLIDKKKMEYLLPNSQNKSTIRKI